MRLNLLLTPKELECVLSKFPNHIILIRPKQFGFNAETASTNSFQNQLEAENLAENVLEEFDVFHENLRALNILVTVFEDESESPDAIFCNNWMAHIPGVGVGAFPMEAVNRRTEFRQDILAYIKEKSGDKQALDYLKYANEGKYLESTGSFVLDYENKVGFAALSPRTDKQLFEKFCEDINFKPIVFEAMDAYGDLIYHTNVVMALGQSFVVICIEAVNENDRNQLESVLLGLGKEIIPISREQMNAFAGNALEVFSKAGEPYLFMSETGWKALNRHQQNRLNAHCKVVTFNIPTIETIGGGSVRCMMTGFLESD